jgi:hypothetical protein
VFIALLSSMVNAFCREKILSIRKNVEFSVIL